MGIVPASGEAASTAPHGEPAALLIPERSSDDAVVVTVVELDSAGAEIARAQHEPAEAIAAVRAAEASGPPRWVLRRTGELLPMLLRAGVVVSKVWDLDLCHEIIRNADRTDRPLPPWTRPPVEEQSAEPALFELSEAADEATGDDIETDAAASLAQFRAQRERAAQDPRLLLLCHAESAGAVVAEEMRVAGVPWDAGVHDELLTRMLGPRSSATGVPARMAELAAEVRMHLDDPRLNIDSPPKLLRALHRVGILVGSTSRWELAEHEHPAIEPLLAYKKLSRLHTANGWGWLAEWVHEGRFRPVYVPGGVVTGRWASSGGGALQLPRSLRPAVRADPGWRLIVADVAQLEPRMLAAMSGDLAMAEAARGTDLYEGVVASGAVTNREEAKYAVLGAMYGATSGTGGQLVPRLRRVFPRAMRLVDDAARRGEDGGTVTTWLGRTAPPPSREWLAVQQRASGADANAGDEQRARRLAAERGRFTRNFVVQGTAAEWSLIWLAEIRHRLAQLPAAETAAAASGPVFAHRAHLAFFLHDEVIVHTPAEQAEAAASAVREAAATATRRLFGDFPLEVPLDLRIAETAQK